MNDYDFIPKKIKNKNKNIITLGIVSLIIILLGSAYAFFTYSRSVPAFTLTSDIIKAEFISGTNSINITNAYPISDEFALANLDKLSYIDFTVKSTINDPNKAISYELYLTGDTTNTLDSNYIKVYLTDESNNKVTEPKTYSNLENTTYKADSNIGKVIYIGNNPGVKTNKFRLYAWIDKDYEQNTISQTFKFNLNIYAYNDTNKELSHIFINDLKEKQTDACKTYLEEDGITYVSGTKTCINFNYVWYSGKLWRITAINPDGTMKMITDDVITTISYGSDVNFYDISKKDDTTYTGSYMYQFLNEDFLDTLYNYQNIIVEDSTWNITTSSSNNTKLPETTLINSSTIGKNTPVGLLNSYEYYLSYKNTTVSSGYLNIGYLWWLLNPYSSFFVWSVSSDGTLRNDNPSNTHDAARPSINLKSNIQLSGGTGTKDDPYTISGDKEQPTINTTLLNTRTIGEYVVFDEDANTSTKELYRIVGIEDRKTKLNKNDYVKDGTTKLIKKFSTNSTYGSGTSDDYWDYYLNNTWYNNLAQKSMLDKGTYYIKSKSSGSYKNSLCNTNNTIETTKSCTKTTSIWTGLVGLPRYGEMFASQQENGHNSSSPIWLITPSSSTVLNVFSGGGLHNSYPSSTNAARPSITLKSNVVITGGDGTKSNPFTIALK